MTKTKSRSNPFYIALVIVGIAFCVTAFAYGVMALRAIRVGPAAREQNPQPLLVFLEEHGDVLMAGELAFLILFTVAALGTDSFWNRARKKRQQSGGHFGHDHSITDKAATPAASAPSAPDANDP